MATCGRRLGGLILIAAGVATLVLPGSAQQQPTVDRAPDSGKGKNVLVVRGCVSGSLLTNTEARDYSPDIPNDVRITGSRSIRGLLKELDGHQVEVTGTLKGVTGLATGGLVKDTGKTKIYVGGTERHDEPTLTIDQQMEKLRGPTLEVASVKDIAPACAVGQD
jgi:hypothetical protein